VIQTCLQNFNLKDLKLFEIYQNNPFYSYYFHVKCISYSFVVKLVSSVVLWEGLRDIQWLVTLITLAVQGKNSFARNKGQVEEGNNGEANL
jgi:hypothetical protein